MPRINIEHSTRLPEAETRKRVAEVMKDVERRFELTGRWDGNRYTFARMGLDGVAVIEPGRVTVELDLGFLLSPLKGRIKSEIESRLAESLP